MEKYQNLVLRSRGEISFDQVKTIRRQLRQQAFHQRKRNEAISLMENHFNGAENNWGFSTKPTLTVKQEIVA